MLVWQSFRDALVPVCKDAGFRLTSKQCFCCSTVIRLLQIPTRFKKNLSLYADHLSTKLFLFFATIDHSLFNLKKVGELSEVICSFMFLFDAEIKC